MSVRRSTLHAAQTLITTVEVLIMFHLKKRLWEKRRERCDCERETLIPKQRTICISVECYSDLQLMPFRSLNLLLRKVSSIKTVSMLGMSSTQKLFEISRTLAN